MTRRTHLNILDDQDPLVVSVVLGTEPLVRGEGLLASCQYVNIPVSNPGHLHVKGQSVSMDGFIIGTVIVKKNSQLASFYTKPSVI
jgi:hypothetical protein